MTELRKRIEIIKNGLIFQLWCVSPPFPFNVEDFEGIVSMKNMYRTVLTPKDQIPKTKDKSGKDITEEMRKSMQIDENGFPYWTCDTYPERRHYVTNV